MAQRTRPPIRLLVASALVAALAAAVAHDVPTEPTAEDKRYAGLILSAAGYADAGLGEGAKPDDFEGQVRAIVAVQDAVLRVAGENRAVPFGQPREPKDVYELRHGLCYDRSRVIEKLLAWLGFETRHVAVYAAEPSWIAALLTPQSPSHAVTEVLTRKGWMAVDSNRRWIGLDRSREVAAVGDLRHEGAAGRAWAAESSAPIDKIFRKPFIYVRGLYSRHGYFFPPYTPVPDYNLRQLAGNVLD